MVYIMLAVFVFLLILGMPLTYVMGVTAVIGMIMDPSLPNMMLGQQAIKATNSFVLLAVPFFMLAGNIMEKTGITEKIINCARTLIGHLRGGMGSATALSGMVLASITGSANASATALSSLMQPIMLKEGYARGFATSLIASAGVLGPIIPPSIVMIIYASCSGQSIAAMFAAGIVPGIIIGIGYMFYCWIYAKKHHIPTTQRASAKEMLKGIKDAIWALLMPVIIIGGTLFGIFTATEAGAIACVYGILYGVMTRSFTLKDFISCLKESAYGSVSPMTILCFASMLTYMLTRENFAATVTTALTSLTTNYFGLLFIIIALVTLLGMFMEVNAAILMIVPMLTALAVNMGYDDLHFAMIVVLTFILGGITPPVGITLYVACGVGNTSFSEAVKYIWPFVIIILLVIALVVFFPEITLFLPKLMGLH